MTRDEHDRAVSRMYAGRESLWRPLLWTVALGAVLASLTWAAGEGCGNMDPAYAEPAPCVAGGERHAPPDGPAPHADDCLPARVDPEAFALAEAVLAWQPTAAIRARAVRAVAVEVVAACREIVGARLGDDCPALLMVLAWRESAFLATARGRPPVRACGTFQLHGAAPDTWTCAEALDVRRNTRLAADWIVQCDTACVGTEEALVMYATGTCRGNRRARWGARRLVRMARDLRAGGGT